MEPEDKIVEEIRYNWYYTTDEDGGEGYETYKVGVNCESIDYHSARGEGDAHYCDVKLKDDRIVREFNLNKVVFN